MFNDLASLSHQPTAADRARALDVLRGAIKERAHAAEQGRSPKKKAYLINLAKAICDTMPEAAMPYSDINLWGLQNYFDQRDGGRNSFVASIDRWNALLANVREHVTPHAPPYPETGDVLYPMSNSTRREWMRSFGKAREKLETLVHKYEGAPQETQMNFPAFVQAIKPYQFAIHAMHLAEQMKGPNNAAPEQLSAAIKEFLNNPLHKEYLEKTPKTVGYLQSFDKQITLIPLANTLFIAGVKEMLPATAKEADYTTILSGALRRDVKTHYQGDSAAAVAANHYASWLDEMQNYRWALAADTVIQEMQGYKTAYREGRDKAIKGRHSAAEQKRKNGSPQAAIIGV